MGYFDDLKKNVIEKCFFKYVESNNGSYEKDRDTYLHDFSYSDFDTKEAVKFLEPEYGNMTQKEFVLLNGNGHILSEELLAGMQLTDSQRIVQLLAYYFWKLAKNLPNSNAKKISNANDLNNCLSSLIVNDMEEVALMLDLRYFISISRNQLSDSITTHEYKKVFHRNTFENFHPIIFVPRLGGDEILAFNNNYSFCYSDLEIFLQDNKVKVKVKVDLQSDKYLKFLAF